MKKRMRCILAFLILVLMLTGSATAAATGRYKAPEKTSVSVALLAAGGSDSVTVVGNELDNGSIEVKITASASLSDINVMLAAYSDDGKMIACKTKTVKLRSGSNSVYFDKDYETASYKVFVTDSTFRPIANAAVVAPEEILYTVRFVDYKGTVLSEQRVAPGEAAAAPVVPAREGYEFVGWDKDFSDITADMTVTAQYRKVETGPVIEVATVSAKAGDKSVRVAVSVRNNPGILGMILTVHYDSRNLTLKNSSVGSAVKDVLVMTKPGAYEDGCRFTWDGIEISSDQIKDGAILVLEFNVASAAQGECPVTVSYEDGEIVDNDLISVQPAIIDGGINVSK